jgi:hypothetical protein
VRNWKKTAIVFTLATGLLITGTSLTTINVSDAAPKSKIEATVQQKSHQAAIKKIKNLATQGKTVNSEKFALRSRTSAIIKKWGKPDEGSDEAYLYYSKRNISFAAENGKVETIYSADKSYFDITYKEVKKTLGKPVQEVKGEDGIYVTYKAGKNSLEFVFYYNDEGTAPSTIKEVSVS